jgi:AraC family transcriptional regulator
MNGMTLGHAQSWTDGSGFAVADVVYAPGDEYVPHAHELTYVSFVVRGSFREEAERESAEARSASVIVMPAGVRHRNRIGERGARSIVIALSRDFERRLRLPRRHRLITRGPAIGVLARACEAYRLSDLLTIEELLFELRDEPPRETPGNLAAAIEMLNDDFASPLHVERIADRAQLSAAYLCRAFRRHFGCTMGQYLRQVRARRAAHLLASTDVPLSEIAVRCGFADQSHLTRVFKAHLAMTPRAYRAFARLR